MLVNSILLKDTSSHYSDCVTATICVCTCFPDSVVNCATEGVLIQSLFRLRKKASISCYLSYTFRTAVANLRLNRFIQSNLTIPTCSLTRIISILVKTYIFSSHASLKRRGPGINSATYLHFKEEIHSCFFKALRFR